MTFIFFPQESICTLQQPCKNSGSCAVAAGTPGYQCTCANNGYTGPTCEVSACDANPCANGAQCTPSAASPGYTCSCPVGFSGPTCSVSFS